MRTGLHRSAGGDHVVNDDDPLAAKLASWGGNRQSAGDILPPLRC